MYVEAMTPSAKERLYRMVEVYQEDDLGCWIFLGDMNRERPRITVNQVRGEAYKFFWAAANGRDPEGMLLHSCDTARCVNPSHLREGTGAENNADAKERGRNRNQNVGKQVCKRGHDLTDPEVLYVLPSGRRQCRVCASIRKASRAGG